jgi:hypothetical protein
MHDKHATGTGDPIPTRPSLQPSSSTPAPRWYAIRHPIIDVIGYALCYGLILYGAVIVGGVIGILINEELAQRKLSAPVWYQLPVRDHTPGPEVFEGVV